MAHKVPLGHLVFPNVLTKSRQFLDHIHDKVWIHANKMRTILELKLLDAHPDKSGVIIVGSIIFQQRVEISIYVFTSRIYKGRNIQLSALETILMQLNTELVRDSIALKLLTICMRLNILSCSILEVSTQLVLLHSIAFYLSAYIYNLTQGGNIFISALVWK